MIDDGVNLIDCEMVRSIKDLGFRCNNEGYFKTIIELFEKQSLSLLSQIYEAIHTADYRQVAHICHSLKGSSLCLGAKKLAAACNQLEVEAKKDILSAQTHKQNLQALAHGLNQVFLDSLKALKQQL